MQLDPYLIHTKKINARWVKGLSAERRIIKLLGNKQENMFTTLEEEKLSESRHKQAQTMKDNGGLNSNTLKCRISVYQSTMRKMKRQNAYWEKILETHTIGRRLLSKRCEEFQNINKERTTQSLNGQKS